MPGKWGADAGFKDSPLIVKTTARAEAFYKRWTWYSKREIRRVGSEKMDCMTPSPSYFAS
jgi:hypothetical protein